MKSKITFKTAFFLLSCCILLLPAAASSQQSTTQQKNLTDQQSEGKSYEELYRIYKSMGIPDTEIDKLLGQLNVKRPPGFVIPELTQSETDSLQLIFFNLQLEELKKLQEEAIDDTLSVEAKIKKLQMEIDSLQVVEPYGYSMFKSEVQPQFPITFGQVIPDYPLGPDDEIIIDLSGEIVRRYTEKITRAGNIFIERVGSISLTNLTLGQAEARLKREFAKSYNGINDGTIQMSMSLGRNRNIGVSVSGEVRLSKTVFMSSLGTALDALYFAGGPNDLGSLRNISIVRNNELIGKLDIYQYLSNGTMPDIRLQNNDRIIVPLVGKTVSVTGEVKREAIYELGDGETLADVIRLSGGFASNARRDHIQIIRSVSDDGSSNLRGDQQVIDVWPDRGDNPENIPLYDGDEIIVPAISEYKRSYIEIEGAVKRPGTYMYVEGMSLNDLLEKSGGVTEDALLERGIVKRLMPDSTYRAQAFTLSEDDAKKALLNFELQNLDFVTIYSRTTFREKAYVDVKGEVNAPDRFDYAVNMTVKDAILMAGGWTDEALRGEIELSRRIPNTNDFSVQTYQISEDFTVTDGDITLQKYDQISIKRDPKWENQQSVVILGEVNSPGAFSIAGKEETLVDLIGRAAGFKNTAYQNGIVFMRFDEEGERQRVGINIEKALKKPGGNDNIALVDGDSIYIPKKTNLVHVRGEVNIPRSVLFKEGKGFKYYIERSGGKTETADGGRIQIVLANGEVTTPRRFWPDRKIIPGSTIIIPERQQKEGFDWNQALVSFTQITSAIVTVIAITNK